MSGQQEENVKTIFGLKLKQLRKNHKFSLLDLARIAGVSPSYLNEIEKGKKFPKEDKIASLAKALNTSYDAMVSLKLTEKLGPLNDLFQNRFLKDLPLEMFGLEWNRIVDWMSQAPAKVNALVSTLVDMARSYNLSRETFFYAALRTYQEMHQNYFDDIEEAVNESIKQFDLNPAPPIKAKDLEDILQDHYNYEIIKTNFEDNHPLQKVKSVYYSDTKPILYLNQNLNSSQKLFVLAKELGFNYLKIKERPPLSHITEADNFELVLNNFRASYFASALIMNKSYLNNDLDSFIKMEDWDAEQIMYMMKKYNVSAETFGHRLTNLVPQHFGLKELFFLRFQSDSQHQYRLDKELHLHRTHTPWSNELLQNYCHRWSGIQAIKLLEENRSEPATKTPIHTQIAKFHNTELEYFIVTIPKAIDTESSKLSSISIGFALTNTFKKKVSFWEDKNIPVVTVGVTCETCAIKNCKERVADPIILKKELQKKEINEAVLNLKQHHHNNQ